MIPKLTVLFHTWPAAFDCPGGGEVQLLQYEKHLIALGIRVLRYDSWHPQFDQVDLVHHFSSQTDILFCEYAKNVRGLPLVISSIFWPEKKHKYDLSRISNLFRLASRILPNSQVECDLLSALLDIPETSFTPILNGVDSCFFKPVSPEHFRAAYGITGPFVLCMANIEARKNQLRLIDALRGTGIQLVLAGQEREVEYAKACLNAADETVHFIGKLEHASVLQRSAYAAAEALVLPSMLETPGLVALEAGAAGVSRLALTSVGCAHEYWGDRATYLNPVNIESIRNAVLSALNRPSRSGVLCDYVAEHFTWKRAAEQLINVYQQVIQMHTCQHLRVSTNVPPAPSVEEILFPLHNQTSPDFVHLSCDEETEFRSPEVMVPPGNYEAHLTYSFFGSVEAPHCLLIDDENGILSSAQLKYGGGQTVLLPLASTIPLRHFSFRITAPQGTTLIVKEYGLRDLELSGTPPSDLARYGLTKYQRLSRYDTILPLENFFVDGCTFDRCQCRFTSYKQESVIYGPYLTLPPGTFWAVVPYSMIESTDIQEKPYSKISTNMGKRVLASAPLIPGEQNYLQMPFTLEEPVKDWELSTVIPKGQQVILLAPHLIMCSNDYGREPEPLVLSPFSPQDPLLLTNSGWHKTECTGSWTSDEMSSLTLLARPQISKLTLTLNPYLGGKLSSRTLRCIVNGREHIHVAIDSMTTLSMYLDDEVWKDGPICEICLLSEEPILSPLECGESTDARKLGFFLHSLKIEYIRNNV